MVIVGLKSHQLLNKFNCFYGTALLWFLLQESLDDTDDSTFVDFVGFRARLLRWNIGVILLNK